MVYKNLQIVELEEYKMNLNKDITKIMFVGGQSVKINIKISGSQVTTFKYLGTEIADRRKKS